MGGGGANGIEEEDEGEAEETEGTEEGALAEEEEGADEDEVEEEGAGREEDEESVHSTVTMIPKASGKSTEREKSPDPGLSFAGLVVAVGVCLPWFRALWGVMPQRLRQQTCTT